ncbi:MAG: Fic family protein [Candidatus Pacebacteria bacterium]|nr:Fic family protein [Candidatus Paceibacterota bacterium]
MSMESVNQNQQDNLKFRKERFDYLLKFLGKIGLDDVAESVGKGDEFIETMSPEEFNSWLIRINGILRDIPTSKRRFLKDPEFVRLFSSESKKVSYTPPINSLKSSLLSDAFSAYKRIKAKGQEVDASLMLGSTINAIHPFMDGNGRTARFVSAMLASSDDNLVLYEPDPSGLQPLIENYIYEKKHNLENVEVGGLSGVSISSTQEMSKEEKQEISNILENDIKTFIKACRIYLKNNQSLDVFAIDPSKKKEFVQNFFDKNKNNMKDLIETYNNLKIEYIETLIDVFENPSKYYLRDIPNASKQFRDGYENKFSEKTLLEIFYLTNLRGVEKDGKITDLANSI